MIDKPTPTGDGVSLTSMAHPGNPFDTMTARIASVITGGCVDREGEEKAREILEAIREPHERLFNTALPETDLPTTERLSSVWQALIDAALKGA